MNIDELKNLPEGENPEAGDAKVNELSDAGTPFPEDQELFDNPPEEEQEQTNE